jgi:hypothetical protein
MEESVEQYGIVLFFKETWGLLERRTGTGESTLSILMHCSTETRQPQKDDWIAFHPSSAHFARNWYYIDKPLTEAI